MPFGKTFMKIGNLLLSEKCLLFEARGRKEFN